ncbi:MAG: hypothetical protein HEQ35_25105 [Gloeotrichia echinulata IR180]|nr:hypothetical protein [Gloeotrichia echinulata DEX184]
MASKGRASAVFSPSSDCELRSGSKVRVSPDGLPTLGVDFLPLELQKPSFRAISFQLVSVVHDGIQHRTRLNQLTVNSYQVYGG